MTSVPPLPPEICAHIRRFRMLAEREEYTRPLYDKVVTEMHLLCIDRNWNEGASVAMSLNWPIAPGEANDNLWRIGRHPFQTGMSSHSAYKRGPAYAQQPLNPEQEVYLYWYFEGEEDYWQKVEERTRLVLTLALPFTRTILDVLSLLTDFNKDRA